LNVFKTLRRGERAMTRTCHHSDFAGTKKRDDASPSHPHNPSKTGRSGRRGLDDEKGTDGTVAIEIRADGTRAAATGVLTNAMPAQPLTADVTGAQVALAGRHRRR
jgi:hypothetical protein